MDDHIDPSISVTDNIAKIDALHEQHRLEKLRELIEIYNHYHPDQPIQYNSSDPVELIMKLWARKDDIPPELTFGEPYDSCFRKSLSQSIDPDHSVKIMLLLFEHSELLSTFLVFCYQQLSFKAFLLNPSQDIWERLSAINQGQGWSFDQELLPLLTCMKALTARIKHTKLSQLDLVYIALRLHEYGGVYANSALADFVEIALL